MLSLATLGFGFMLGACTYSNTRGESIEGSLGRKVCAAEHIDSSSMIYLALDATGAVTRLVVTPSEDIADMGSLIFDMKGELLGHKTSGEFPWDDEVMRAQETERVAALMAGAAIPDDAEPIPCR